MGLLVVAGFTACAMAAASALATAPEFGRCLKQNTLGLGIQFKDAKCTEEVERGSKTDKFEWLPGAEKRKFAEKGGIAILTTEGGTSWECKTESGTGEFKAGNAKELTGIVLRFTECVSLSEPFSCPGGKVGEVITNELEGIVGWENKATKKTDLELHPAKSVTSGLWFECEWISVIRVRGNLLVPLKNDAMKPSETVKYAAKKGIQKPDKWEESTENVNLGVSFKGSAFEPFGVELSTTIQPEEAVELNAVV